MGWRQALRSFRKERKVGQDRQADRNGRDNVYFTFLKEYFRNVKEIGSVVPDSQVCFNALLKHVPFDTAKIILEFGAGSGTVTREILKRKKKDTVFISFEKNPTFYERLMDNVQGPNFKALQRDVFQSTRVLMQETQVGKGDVDCIVSTLPCSSLEFDALIRDAVLPLLSGNGCFVQYVHSISVFKGFRLKPLLSRYFPSIKADFVLRNIPPVLIYTCRPTHAAAHQA
jgi:phospholipid N-methyltransferase